MTLSRATHTTTTLIPKKREKIGEAQVPSTPQSRPLGGASETIKKRIAPVLLQADGQLSVNNPASSQNNIRNILGPTIISPKMSNEFSVVPETNGAASASELESTPDQGKKTAPVSQETLAAATTSDASSKSLKTEKKQVGDGTLAKRKREIERTSTQAAAVVAKSREVTARAPKILNERFVYHIHITCGIMLADWQCVISGNHSPNAGSSSRERLLPEFPVRLLFSVQIDKKTQYGSLGLRLDSALDSNTGSRPVSSKVMIEVTVHNMKKPLSEEIIG